jgi:hypothetical protein
LFDLPRITRLIKSIWLTRGTKNVYDIFQFRVLNRCILNTLIGLKKWICKRVMSILK